MIKGCPSLASHKIGEENIWMDNVPDEAEEHRAFNMQHNLTTYLCQEHFDWIMNREEGYMSDYRFDADGNFILI